MELKQRTNVTKKAIEELQRVIGEIKVDNDFFYRSDAIECRVDVGRTKIIWSDKCWLRARNGDVSLRVRTEYYQEIVNEGEDDTYYEDYEDISYNMIRRLDYKQLVSHIEELVQKYNEYIDQRNNEAEEMYKAFSKIKIVVIVGKE